jgi:hypothetical protein
MHAQIASQMENLRRQATSLFVVLWRETDCVILRLTTMECVMKKTKLYWVYYFRGISKHITKPLMFKVKYFSKKIIYYLLWSFANESIYLH